MADEEGRTFIRELKREEIPLVPEQQQLWKAAVLPILDAYVAAAKEKSLPGDEFLKDVQAKLAAPQGQ